MKQGHILLLGATCVVLGFFAAYIPVSYEHVIREGTDTYEAHHALWGKRIKSVTQTASSPVRGVGLILVNLQHGDSPLPVQVAVEVDGQEIARVERVLPLSVDDEFTWFDFGAAVVREGEEYTVSVSATDALQENPIGVRFNIYDRQLALSVRERLPVWEYAGRWIDEHEERAHRGLLMLVGGALAATMLWSFEFLERRFKGAGLLLGLLAIALLTIYLRVPLALGVESAYGGDAFNYFLKSRAWIAGEDPFAADFRKAPLYSFLIMPGLLPNLDPVLWARGISMLAAASTVILVPLFLLRFGLPLSFALGAGALLSVNRDYQFESVQGLANTLYAALIFAASYAFLIRRTYMLHIAAALATLVRYEGAAAAAIFIPASWIAYRLRLQTIIRNMLPAIALLSIPFLVAPFTGSAGVRTISDIQGDEGLYLGLTGETFAPSLDAFRLFFGRLWILAPHVGDPFAWFGCGIILGIAGVWFFKRYGHPRGMMSAFPALLCAALLFGTLFGSEEIKFFIALFAGIAGVGTGAALLLRPRVSVPIVLMVIVQVIAITAILPKTRYYLQIIPFIALATAGGFYMTSGAGVGTKTSRVFALFALCMMGTFAYGDAREHLSGQLSDYNEKSVGQTVLLSAARQLRGEDGVVAVAEGSDLQFRVYLPADRFITMPDYLRDIDAQLAMIREAGAEYVVDTEENPYFAKLIEELPQHFDPIAEFTTKWADTTATVYRVD